MKLSWMFGPSMEQRHLLYVYVAVWVIQGGYAAWVAWQWRRAGRDAKVGEAMPSASQEGY